MVSDVQGGSDCWNFRLWLDPTPCQSSAECRRGVLRCVRHMRPAGGKGEARTWLHAQRQIVFRELLVANLGLPYPPQDPVPLPLLPGSAGRALPGALRRSSAVCGGKPQGLLQDADREGRAQRIARVRCWPLLTWSFIGDVSAAGSDGQIARPGSISLKSSPRDQKQPSARRTIWSGKWHKANVDRYEQQD